MRFLVSILVVILYFNVFAQELELDSDVESPAAAAVAKPAPVAPSNPRARAPRNAYSGFGMPSYIPKAGIFYTDLGMAIVNQVYEVSSGIDAKLNSTSFDFLVGYGITDNFTVAGKGRYYVEETLEVSTSKLKYLGIQEPELGANWRLWNGPTKADLFFSIAPSLFTSKGATATEEGNKANGGNKIIVGGVLNFKFNNWELGSIVRRAQFMDVKSETGTRTTKTATAGQNELYLFASSRLAPRFIAGGAFSLIMTEAYYSESFTSGTKQNETQYEAANRMAVEIPIAYLLTARSLLRLKVSTVLSETHPYKIVSTGSTTNSETKTKSGYGLSLGWSKEF
jgi:hypothetical protein